MTVVRWIIGLIDTLFINFILGLAVSILAIRWHWLDMRIDSGAFILVLLAFVTVVYILNSKYKIHQYFYWQGCARGFGILSFSALIIAAANGFSIGRLAIVPAYTIREGLLLGRVSLSLINNGFIVWLLLGIVTHLYYYKSGLVLLHSKQSVEVDEKVATLVKLVLYALFASLAVYRIAF